MFAACERYQSMQESHLQYFASPANLDLTHLLFEREQHFADLYNHLTAALHDLRHVPDAAPLARHIQERLRQLLRQEAQLTTHVQAYRALLTQRRDQLQQGQRLLHGYSGAPLHPPAQLLDMSS